MSRKKMATLLSTAVVILALGALGASSSVFAKDEMRCNATGDALGVDVSFNFEWRSRPRLDIEIEADPESGVTDDSFATVATADFPEGYFEPLGFGCDFVDPDAAGDADLVCEYRLNENHGVVDGKVIQVTVMPDNIEMMGTCE